MVAFGFGVQLARALRSADQGERATAKKTEKPVSESKQGDGEKEENSKVGSSSPAESERDDPQRKSEASVDRSARVKAARSTAEAAASEGRRVPLGKTQIGNLVHRAINSPSAVERREAFDRVLEEMASDSFTRDQAMMIRSAMAKGGADGNLWQLFDYAWGSNDPATAVAHIDEIAAEHRNGFLYNMLPGLASVEPGTAIEIFHGLNPELQAKVQRRLFEGLIDNNVAVATDYIYDVTDSENYNWRPMDTLARELVADQGVQTTLEWAATLPEGALRGSAWSAAYAHWGSRQPEVAIQSIMGMDPSTDRNLAINGFTAAYAHQDGASALTWAAEITEPNLRSGALVRAATQLYKQDPAAARDWFSGSGMPAEQWGQIAPGQVWPQEPLKVSSEASDGSAE